MPSTRFEASRQTAKSLRQDLIERLAVFDSLLKLRRLGLELLIGQTLQARFERIDLFDKRLELFHVALVLGAEERGKDLLNHKFLT